MYDILHKREAVAKIMFLRFAGQLSNNLVRDEHWKIAYQGWIENPALFPVVETCMDAADEIIRKLEDPEFMP